MRCPVCRADNTTGAQCRRCRADLSLLFALEKQREHLLAEARRAAARGAWSEVIGSAGWADELRRDDDSGQLLALARLMQGDFAGAWRAYRTLSSSCLRL